MLRRFLALACILGGVCHAQQSAPEWVYMNGDRDTVRIVWLPRAWPTDVRGFNVKRRVPGGAWEKLNPAPIAPTLYEADMDTRTNDPARREKLKAQRNDRIRSSASREEPFETVLSTTLSKPDRFENLLDDARARFEIALFHGFAYQDSGIPQQPKYEYGLFPVRLDGGEQPEPVFRRVWTWGTPPSPLAVPFGQPRFADYRERIGISIVLPLPKGGLANYPIGSLQISSRDAEGEVSDWKRISGYKDYTREEVWIRLDAFPHYRKETFHVVPIDYLGYAGKPSPTIVYDRAKYPEHSPQQPIAIQDSSDRPPPPAPPPPPVASPPRVPAPSIAREVRWPQASAISEVDKSSFPAVVGAGAPAAADCRATAAPGEAGYCLWPAAGMHTWLRADDLGPRVRQIKLWTAADGVKNDVIAGDGPGEVAWLMRDALGKFPVARLAEVSSLALRTPIRTNTFTLFVVGRQVPRAERGYIVSSTLDQDISWVAGKKLEVHTGINRVSVPYEGIEEFHVLALRAAKGWLHVYDNRGVVESATVLSIPAGITLAFVGAPARELGDGTSSLGNLRRAFSANAPANPKIGSDIAELILWPGELEDEQLFATMRYLRKKYGLP